MPLVLPYQNAENAFRVILGDFVTEDGRNCSYFAFGADDGVKKLKSRHCGA
jgi:isoleucyl-tRNA synthetase